ncbi:MAG: response regulator [Bacteroidetes bacterium]|nr:MAG: response regulator [Bacteroidota bacterium]
MNNSKKKILVVDDEPDVLKYLETLFSDNGFIVFTAVNGADCMLKALCENPDLITLDISMPSESGVRVFRDLQENEQTKNIPVIIITGITGEFQKFISTRKQVHPPIDYYEKPIDRDKLLLRVKEILKID